MPALAVVRETELIDAAGETVRAAVLTRAQLAWAGNQAGPMLLIDAEATTFIPAGWMARSEPNGSVIVERLVASVVARWSGAALTLGQEAPGDQLGRGDVLDGQPDRLEDADRIGGASIRPRTLDAPDLHEVDLRQ